MQIEQLSIALYVFGCITALGAGVDTASRGHLRQSEYFHNTGIGRFTYFLFISSILLSLVKHFAH
ncbi:MAG: hypothetical protein RL621_1853 [Bacteroidota bacterium]|jgi:hypothetical protein